MSSSSSKAVITHGLALCLGIGGAVLLAPTRSSEPPTAEPELPDRPARSATGPRLSSSSAFRAAYSILVTRSMTRQERSHCMEQLWQQWGAADPLGMIEFLEQKQSWPESFRSYADLDFQGRPDLVLNFALRHGCDNALQNLNDADPSTVAGLLKALPDGQRGSSIIAFEKRIHRELGQSGAGMSEPSPAYHAGVASSLLAEGRLDEFFKVFEKVGDHAEKSDLAKQLGHALADQPPGEELLELALRLPEQYQEDAVFKLMNYQDCAMEFREVRDARKRWIERVASEGFVDSAANAVSELFDDDGAARRGAEWAAWVEGFPEDDSWRPITNAVFRAWRGHDRDEMINQICALPDGPTRQAMAIEAAAATIGGLAQAYDAEDQEIYDRLSALCTEPQARKRFDQRIKPWVERSAQDTDPFETLPDPFAPPDDPFAGEEDMFKGDDDPFAEESQGNPEP